MPRKMLLAICFLFALLTPSRDAHAFWRWIRELSGPGPWFGVDLIFPWSLSQPKLTPEMVNRNRDLLDSLELRLPSIAVTLEELAENQEHIALLNDTFGLSLRKPIASTTFLRTPQGFPDAFVDETTRSPARDLSLLVAELDPEALKYFDASHRDPDLRFRYLNEALMRVQSRRLRSILRRFGAGPAGLFGRKAALPPFRGGDEGDPLKNLFVSVSLGLATTLDNQLEYSREFDGSKRAYWFSVYTALEWRFGRLDTDRNFFLNGGPAVSHFVGEAFDPFSRVSLKSQIGYRYKRLHVGLEGEFFGNAFRPEEFGASQAPFENQGEFNVGFFVSVAITKSPIARTPSR